MALCSRYLTTLEVAVNAFYNHHQNNIRFSYRCFDRILLNGLIQPFQQPERVIGFFNTYRQLYPVSRDVLRDIAGQFQNWVKNRSERWGAPILEAPQGRRDDFVEPYFRKAKSDRVVVILKAREPARILIAIGNKKDNRWHLQIAQRWVIQYNFYVKTTNFNTSGSLNLTSSTNGSSRPSTISSTRLASKPPEHIHNKNKLLVTAHITV